MYCKFSIKAEKYSVETLPSLIITKVWSGIVRNIHGTYSNQNRSNERLKSRIARNPHRIAHLVELRKQISYLLFIAFNFSWTMLLWCLWYSILRKWKYIVILSTAWDSNYDFIGKKYLLAVSKYCIAGGSLSASLLLRLPVWKKKILSIL